MWCNCFPLASTAGGITSFLTRHRLQTDRQTAVTCAGHAGDQGLLHSWATQESLFLLLQVDGELFWNLTDPVTQLPRRGLWNTHPVFGNDCDKVPATPVWSKAALCISRQAGNVEPGQGKQHQCRWQWKKAGCNVLSWWLFCYLKKKYNFFFL